MSMTVCGAPVPNSVKAVLSTSCDHFRWRIAARCHGELIDPGGLPDKSQSHNNQVHQRHWIWINAHQKFSEAFLLSICSLLSTYSSFQVGCPKIATRIRACAHFWWGLWIENFGFSSRFLDNQPENCCSCLHLHMHLTTSVYGILALKAAASLQVSGISVARFHV